MRVLALPVVLLGLVTVDQSNEPSESAMRVAFEARLTAQVQSALDFVAETSGPEGIARVREAGTDRFEMRAFRKLDCLRDDAGHICGFAVDISVVNGAIQKTLKGRFLSGPGGRLTFTQES